MERWIWRITGGIGCVRGERWKEGKMEERGMRYDKTKNRVHNEVGV